MEIEMKIRGLMVDPSTNAPIVILKDVQGDTVLPIWVGLYEANAIALEVEKATTPRPMTHDLLANVITEMGGIVDRIEINDLVDHTFFAIIHVKRNGSIIKIDSRPSDAIALGIASTVPIFVAEHVLTAVS